MDACGLILFGDEYEYLPNLSSPKASALSLYATLDKSSSDYLPRWRVLEEPKPIGDSENLISTLNTFEEEVRLGNSDVVFVYISGHGYSERDGDIFIYLNNSKVGNVGTGLKISTVLSILCNHKLKHIVLCLDLCRTYQGPVAFKQQLTIRLKELKSNFDSLIIVFSTVEGETTYGGKKDQPSPFALGLLKMFSKEYIETPMLYFENVLKKLLTNEYIINSLKKSDPEIITIPEENSRNIFGFVVSSANSEEVDISSFNSLDLLLTTILAREKQSFVSDSFISAYNELIPLKVKAKDQSYNLEELLVGNSNPIVIEGESGAGKTISAKRVSYFIASEYRDNRIGKIAIYFNAGFLNNYCENSISPVDILQLYFKEGRYFVNIIDIESFFRGIELVLIVDGIEDLRDKNVLIPFLKNCKDKKVVANFVILCQPYDKDRLLKDLNSRFVFTGKIEPISKVDIKTQDEDLYDRIGEKIKLELLPLELQLIKRFITNNPSEQITNRQILQYEYDIIKQRIEDRVNKIQVDLKRRSYLKTSIIHVFRLFALELREIGSFQFFRIEDGEILFHKVIIDIDLNPIDYSLFLEIGIRADVFVPGDKIRYSHRSTQELLIAFEWIYSQQESAYFLMKSKASAWGSTIAKYSALVDKSGFPYYEIVSDSPILIVDCINHGFEPSEREVEVLINNLLRISSHWTRNETANSLTKLPNDLSKRLMDTYLNEIDFDRKTTIAIALGKFNNDENVEFLISDYENSLQKYSDPKSQFLRRRILDVIKGKFGIAHIRKWNEFGICIEIKEWARILRSVNIQNQQEINELNGLISQYFKGIELSLLEIILSSKAQVMLNDMNQPEHVSKIKLSNDLIAFLELENAERLYKCIPALIIEELMLVDLSESLLEALSNEKDIYAIGELSYVLGKIGDSRIIRKLLIYISRYINSQEFQDLKEDAKLGFFNDVELGLIHAIDNGNFDKDFSINFLPDKLRLFISSAITLNEERK